MRKEMFYFLFGKREKIKYYKMLQLELQCFKYIRAQCSMLLKIFSNCNSDKLGFEHNWMQIAI